ncbi:MAG: tail fiber protein [Betaproteobacteria bacterium]|nr:tail fiber protein [Betaproteobacteria bacterium]
MQAVKASIEKSVDASVEKTINAAVLQAVQAAVAALPPAPAESIPEGVPPGTVVAFGAHVAPEGWLLCDGANRSREDYAALFAVIATTFGSGDGLATFNVPDFRGRFLRGADLGAGRDLDRINRNEGLGTAQRDNFKQHVHTPAGGGRFVVEGAGLDKAWVGTARGFTTPLQTSIAGGTETRPMNVAVNWIIKF